MQNRLRSPMVAPTWSGDLVTIDAAVGGIRGDLFEREPATGARVAPRVERLWLDVAVAKRTELPVDAPLER